MKLNRMRKWLVFLGCAVLLLVLSGASHQAQAESPGHVTFKPPKSLDQAYVPGEVLVKFKDSPATFRGKPSREHLRSLHGAAAAEFVAALPTKAQAALKRVQGQVLRVHPSIGVLRVKLPSQASVAKAIEALYRSGTVEYAEPNAVIIPQAAPDDPLFPDQWGLNNTSTSADIKALEAWDIVYPGNIVPPGSNKTIVAVIDTGVDYLHQDFYDTLDLPSPFRRYTDTVPPLYFPGDPLKSNLWVNRGEEVENIYFVPDVGKVFFRNGIDDDDNHFVDDYFGINVTVTPSTGDPMDTHGHGTAMAGIIGAVGNNARCIAGVNWQTRIMALKAMTGTSGNVDMAITCINYALSQRANETPTPPMVLTLGWSQSSASTYSSPLHDALRIAQNSGVLVVAAAGNNNEDNDIFPNYPSSFNHDPKDFPTVDSITLDNIITVGASDQFDQKETNSCYGLATVDLFAPGKDIYSTTDSSTVPSNKYSTSTGTSYAAAHVAGACALLWNKYPDKNWKQIKALVMNGAEDGVAQDFRTICVTEGRLNLANSLNPAIVNAPAVFSIFEVTPALGDPFIVPGRADTNDTLVITGVNFGAGGTLSFLGATFPAANIVSWSDEQIKATVPAGLPKGTGRLLVTKAGGLTSRGACFSNITRDKLVGSLILGRALAASAQIGNDVWVMGGRSYWGIVPHVEKYALDTNHAVIDSDWMMPTPVSNSGAASIGAKIYVVGGATEDASTNAIPVDNLQIFDTASLTWEAGPPLPKALMQCAVTSLNGKLYVFGGLIKSGATTYAAVTDTYVFDPATNAWSGIRVLPTATAYAAVAPTGSGKIWVMGGFSSSSTTSQQTLVQEYDPATNAWTPQRHLVRPRGGAAGINYGGQVYCLRGTKPYSSYVDKYADGEWYNLAWGYWMPSIMNYLGIYVSPPNVLARSGLYTPSPGKYLDKIFLLGGASGTESTYKYSYSNKVWAFPAPGKATADITPVLYLLLMSE
ncbi:MAG: S8 family serine peptidase [Proteobacteria bacterium]|nr:S8 family serine peptidase [Pseudomonadota bacterium]